MKRKQLFSIVAIAILLVLPAMTVAKTVDHMVKRIPGGAIPNEITITDIFPSGNAFILESQEVQGSEVSFCWNANGYPPDPDSGYAGTVESLNVVQYAYSQLFVHTYSPDPHLGKFIYSDCFIKETRLNRTLAYLITPTIDFYRDDEWHLGPILGGAIIWENDRLSRTWIGTNGVGLILNEDSIILFRTCIRYWLEVDRGETWIRFQLNNTEISPIGIWYYDVAPYNYCGYGEQSNPLQGIKQSQT